MSGVPDNDEVDSTSRDDPADRLEDDRERGAGREWPVPDVAALRSQSDIQSRRDHCSQGVRFAAVHDLVREERAAETCSEVVSRARETLLADLSFPYVTVHLFDGESMELKPAREPTQFGCEMFAADSPLFSSAAEGPGWRAFTDTVELTFSNFPEEDGSGDVELAKWNPWGVPRSCIFEPLGEYGVLAVGAPERAAFSTADIEIVGIVGETLRTAFNRLENEGLLQEQRRSLQKQESESERLANLNQTIRDVMRELPEASTHKEIEQTVCTLFGGTGDYALAGIGHSNPTTDTIEVNAVSGEEAGYLREIPIRTDVPVEDQEPMARAATTGEPQVITKVHSDPPYSPWEREMLRRGIQSVVAVPLSYEARDYGVFGIYTQDSNAITKPKVEVLSELADAIAHALTALDRKFALVGDKSIELEFDISDPSLPVIQLVQETDADVFELETIVRNSDDSLRVFFAIEGPDINLETALEFAESKVTVDDYSLLSQTEDALHFECTIIGDSILFDLLEHGAVPQRVIARETGVRLAAEVPQNTNVRRFVTMTQKKYETVELVARRERDRPIQTDKEFTNLIDELLTERQLEVLKTGYFAGFFEWPRDATGEEVAEVLDVSQPTFARHVRHAENRLFGTLFEDADEPDELP